MAKVYLALMAGPAGFNKLLVIKILREDLLASSADSVQMFWEEARLAARLSHPNIVQTHEVGEIGGRYFIAMEYLDGQPYSAVLTRTRKEPIPLPEHLRIISETARALHYSHNLTSYQGESIGVVHRDVSPHNVFVTYDGQVKLLDFGVATTQDPEHVTRVGVIKGKLDYIAPEQLRGEALDGRADIFALGAVLWEVLAGGQRFAGGRKVNDVNKVQTRLSGGERKIREVVPTLPAELESIVERAIALDPAARFGDAASFADAIDAYLASIGERPSAKSLSAVLCPLFEAERAEIHELIDEQMQAMKRAPLAIEIGDATGSLPRIERGNTEELSSLYVSDSQKEPGSAVRSGYARPAGPMRSTVMPGVRSRRGLFAGIAAALVMAAGALIAFLWPRPATPLAVSTPAPIEAPAASAPVNLKSTSPEAPPVLPPSATPEQGGVQLQINVTPPSARLTIDGASVPTPFSGQFRKDSALHLVEASADGYRASKQFVKFERDQTVVFSLERIPVAPVARRPSASEQRRSEAAAERRDQAPAPTEAAAPAAPKPVVPGADIDFARPASGDDIYHSNPYRN